MAKRNRVAVSNRLFSSIIASAQAKGVQIQSAASGRYIARKDESDAKLLAEGNPSAIKLSRQVRFTSIEFEGTYYFCAAGFGAQDLPPLGLEPTELTPALFALCVLESGLAPRTSSTGSDIREAIEADHVGVKGYQGHDLAQIAALYAPISCYKSNALEEFHASPHRVAGALAARTLVDGPFQPSTKTLKRLEQLFEVGSGLVPYAALLQGVMAISWDQFFLQVYRCIEQLYSVPRLQSLCEEWPANSSLRDLSKLLETKLGWRPKEDESLLRLFQHCDASNLSEICVAFGIDTTDMEPPKLAENATRKVYALRNSVVHFRAAQEGPEITDAQWDEIVCALLDAISKLYDELGTKYFDLQAAAA